MAKQISPVNIWVNGSVKVAEQFTLRSINDDLETSATFYYELKEAVVVDEEGASSGGAVLSVGNVAMDGQDYIDWDNSNEQAYAYIAGKLNLVII